MILESSTGTVAHPVGSAVVPFTIETADNPMRSNHALAMLLKRTDDDKPAWKPQGAARGCG